MTPHSSRKFVYVPRPPARDLRAEKNARHLRLSAWQVEHLYMRGLRIPEKTICIGRYPVHIVFSEVFYVKWILAEFFLQPIGRKRTVNKWNVVADMVAVLLG
jgi:hypothetical protein